MEARTTLETARETAAYRLDRVELKNATPDIFREWSAFLERSPSISPLHDPQWLREYFAEEKDNLFVYFLYRGESLRGFAPFLVKDWPVKWQLGEIMVARLPLRRLRLLGGAAHFPQDLEAYELLFRELLSEQNHFDALYLDDVPVDSILWKFLESSSRIADSYSRYVPELPAPRVLLRLDGSFDDYMGRFSAKHRQTLRRKMRKFQEVAPGDARSVRFTQPEEVDTFVQQAAAISQKTYQYKLLGGGLRADEKTRRHLLFLAQRGWLRSYLLVCKGTPCAFVTGFQYGSRLYLDDMGYDPAWRDYSVGTVLQLEIIEDLFAYNRPEIYDLGEYGPHKEEFATENYTQGKVFLFRRKLYTTFVRAGHQGCAAGTIAVSSLLERFGWKKRLKRLIRMLSSRS